MKRSSKFLWIFTPCIFALAVMGCGSAGPWPTGTRPAPPARPAVARRPLLPQGPVLPPPGPRDEAFATFLDRTRRLSIDDSIAMLESEPAFVTYHHSQLGTLLIHVAGMERPQLVRYLLEHGADPNARGLRGFDALINCVDAAGSSLLSVDGKGRIENNETLDLLLAWGANPNSGATVGYRMDDIEPTDTILVAAEKLQRNPSTHALKRNVLIVRLREHIGLPVDAMLPLNANSLYLRPEAGDSK